MESPESLKAREEGSGCGAAGLRAGVPALSVFPRGGNRPGGGAGTAPGSIRRSPARPRSAASPGRARGGARVRCPCALPGAGTARLAAFDFARFPTEGPEHEEGGKSRRCFPEVLSPGLPPAGRSRRGREGVPVLSAEFGTSC